MTDIRGTVQSASIGNSLDVEARKKLADYLAPVLPGSTLKKERFIAAVGGVLDVYHKMTVPYREAHRRTTAAANRIGNDARDLASRLRKLDRATRGRIALEAIMAERGRQPRPVDEEADKRAASEALVSGNAFLDGLVEKLDALARIATKIEGSRKPSRATDRLIKDLAQAYGAAFGEQPSASKTGIFRNVVRIIFQAAEISEKPDEERLKRLLASEPLPGKPPRRGRKRNNQTSA